MTASKGINRPRAPQGVSLKERLAFHTAPPNANGCRLWTGTPTASGYGQFWWKGKLRKAHQLSLEDGLGRPLKKGLNALHCCPNKHDRMCIEFTHLYEGTIKQNNQDMIEMGTHYKIPPRPGEEHGNSVLTDEQVYAIRHATGKPQGPVAEKFGITPANVSFIQRRKTWTHLPERDGDPFMPDKHRYTRKQLIKIAKASGTTLEVGLKYKLDPSYISRLRRKYGDQ